MKNKEKTRSVLSRFSSRSICSLSHGQKTIKRPEYRLHKHTWFCGGDKQTLQQTYFRRSASCVQSFDDSLDIAIRITYRISLRSSSLWEPRHPLLKVLNRYFVLRKFRIKCFGLFLFFYSKGIKRFCFITKNERNVVCVLCPRDVVAAPSFLTT